MLFALDALEQIGDITQGPIQCTRIGKINMKDYLVYHCSFPPLYGHGRSRLPPGSTLFTIMRLSLQVNFYIKDDSGVAYTKTNATAFTKTTPLDLT
jgi:hypothetical protein